MPRASKSGTGLTDPGIQDRRYSTALAVNTQIQTGNKGKRQKVALTVVSCQLIYQIVEGCNSQCRDSVNVLMEGRWQ